MATSRGNSPDADAPRTLPRRTVLAMGGGLAAGLVASRDERIAAAPATPAGTPSDLLFVQDCESGTLRPLAGQRGGYTLSLQHGLGRTIYFSDRPRRLYGSLPTPDFLAAMSAASNPPNAALVVQLSATDAEVAILELHAPRYNATTHVLTYDVKALTAAPGQTFSKPPLRATALPAAFGAASLFIDGLKVPNGFNIENRTDRPIHVTIYTNNP